MRWTFIGFLLGILAAATTRATGADEVGNQLFESKIRPLLTEHCYKCHSASSAKLKANLYLDSREGMLKGGDSGPSVVPGQPTRSRLIEAIGYANVDLQMPPKSKLNDQQIADLTRWVMIGAPWPSSKTSSTIPSEKKEF